ncbi:MAG: hypothetical protein JSR67_03670 [Proteobacteria bacterium]|nr:hypothetical protein [Pseudomonadota bacterium]
MSPTVRNRIMDGILAALNAATPSGVPQTLDGRTEPFQAAELPSIVLFELREEDQPQKDSRWSPFLDRTFTVRLEVRVIGQPARTAADPILAWIGQVLGGSQIGGLAIQCHEVLTEWQRVTEDYPYTLVQTDYRISYVTLMTDPTRQQ